MTTYERLVAMPDPYFQTICALFARAEGLITEHELMEFLPFNPPHPVGCECRR